jgi:hypothetical protein
MIDVLRFSITNLGVNYNMDASCVKIEPKQVSNKTLDTGRESYD